MLINFLSGVIKVWMRTDKNYFNFLLLTSGLFIQVV